MHNSSVPQVRSACFHLGFRLIVDIVQQRAKDSKSVRLWQSERHKGSLDDQPRQRRRGNQRRLLKCDIEGIWHETADSIFDSAQTLISVDFKAEVGMDCLADKNPGTHDANAAIDGSALDEAVATADCCPGSQSWACTGVDVSGGDDPFHADWPYWK